jgi:surface polysaccharide O-acyltransferase-like enzyme
MRNRLVHYDLLRIFAAYLIIMLHLSVSYIYPPPESFQAYTQWEYAIAFSAFSRVGVPIFIMLSGLFLLNPYKKISVSMIFIKYLPKVILIFIFWSFFYAFEEQDFFRLFSESASNPAVIGSGFSALSTRFSLCFDTLDHDFFWHAVVKGHYHMWYLYMLAGLYLITPLLRVFAAHATKQQFVYFITLCMGITFITKFNDTLWRIKLLSEALDTLALTFVFGYIGYFLAGYFLDTLFTGSSKINILKCLRNKPLQFALQSPKDYYWHLTKYIVTVWDKRAAFIYALGLASFVFTTHWTTLVNPMFGFKKPELLLFSNYSPTVFLMSFAVFAVAAKAKNVKFPKLLRVLAKKLPQYMLLVYMIHPFIISETRKQGVLTAHDFALSLPLNAFFIFLISLAVSIVILQAYHLICRIFTFRLN